MIRNIDKFEFISFDIFDTLIKRNVNEPRDVFRIVEKIYNKENETIEFEKLRVSSEEKARANKPANDEDITLDLIYDYLSQKIDSKICKELKKIEIEVECKISNINRDIIGFYNECKKNKRIIITSDIYLPRYVIEKILKTNGIEGYEKLYISSEIKKTKASGHIFDYIINDLGVNPQKILHVGDNFKSDYFSPKAKRIK